MMRVEIHPTHPQPRLIKQVVERLREGAVIVYPTDTVYGLGCDIHNKKAVERIYELKRMRDDHPVSFVCPDLSNISKYGVVDNFAYRIMKSLVPGPYTFILKATRDAPRPVMRKRQTVGIRVPRHPVAIALLHELGTPIVSSSASINGEQLCDPDAIALQFNRADIFVDSGWGGLEPSTMIDLTGDAPKVLREGAGPVDF